jgi:peptidoglycan/xylan/chitin deacetylase (PgdA/CDA1 family)
VFFDRDIKGDRLPPRTVCLTYDDGPGPQTRELAYYLHEQGVAATFFVIGAHARQYPDVLRALHECGHLVANHTDSHPGLVKLATSGGDVVGELVRTDDVIRPHVAGAVAFFRAPYGNWREKQGPDYAEDRGVSVVAALCNRARGLRHYVGPINWDISGHDYDYWRRGASAGECLGEYLERAEAVGRGIVLMHDSSDGEAVRRHNRAAELTRLLVPRLKERGYRFVRLDAIPQVRSAVRVDRQVALGAAGGARLALRRDGSDRLGFTPGDGDRQAFGIVPLGGRRVALRADNGLYWSVQPDGEVRANAAEVGGRETYEVEERRGGQVFFRTTDGAVLGPGPGGDRLRAAEARDAAGLCLERRFAQA